MTLAHKWSLNFDKMKLYLLLKLRCLTVDFSQVILILLPS